MQFDEARVIVELGLGTFITRSIILDQLLSRKSYKKLKDQGYIEEEERTTRENSEKYYIVSLTKKGNNFVEELRNAPENKMSLGLFELLWLLKIYSGNITERAFRLWMPHDSTLYDDLKRYIKTDGNSKFIELTPEGKLLVEEIVRD